MATAPASKTGGLGTSAITNDDQYTLDLPDLVEDYKYDYAHVKDERSY